MITADYIHACYTIFIFLIEIGKNWREYYSGRTVACVSCAILYYENSCWTPPLYPPVIVTKSTTNTRLLTHISIVSLFFSIQKSLCIRLIIGTKCGGGGQSSVLGGNPVSVSHLKVRERNRERPPLYTRFPVSLFPLDLFLVHNLFDSFPELYILPRYMFQNGRQWPLQFFGR